MFEKTEFSPTVTKGAHRLMKEVLPLKDQRFVDSSKFDAIANRLNINDIEAKIYFLRELHAIVRKLPLKIFDDEQNRFRMLTAIQDALDAAIDQEEEELE